MEKQSCFCFLFGFFLLCTSAHGAKEGWLTVTTNPETVEVWLDEHYIGNSPIIEKKVATGNYRIRLVDPVQRLSHSESISITEGKTSVLDKKLERRFGSIRINSHPQNADVYLTIPLGKTPLYHDNVIPGRYTVEIRHPDEQFNVSQQTVTLNGESAVTITDTLARKAKPKSFGTKEWIRIGLGTLTVAGFGVAIAENGYRQSIKHDSNRSTDAARAGVRRNIGIAVGALCITGVEIIAFF